MTRRLAMFATAAVAAGSLAAWLILGLADTSLALRLVGTAAAAALALLLLGRLAPAGTRPDAFEDVWRRGSPEAHAPDPPERQSLQRLVRLAISSADVAHERLRPLLRDVADARLEAYAGTHLDRDPQAAERLGPVAWEWLRPDRREPPNRHAPGPTATELAAVVAAVDRLSADDAPTAGTRADDAPTTFTGGTPRGPRTVR